MTPEEFAKIVAFRPPQAWAEIRRRIEAVERYQDIRHPTRRDAGEAAAGLGMTERSFYRLIRTLSASIRQPKREARGNYKRLDPRVERVIDEAIRDLGPGVSNSRVYVDVVLRCGRADLDPPSDSAVTHRIQRPSAAPSVVQRIGRECDLVLDSAFLPIALPTEAGAAPAVITAVIATRDGLVLAHRLDAGQPSVGALPLMFVGVASATSEQVLVKTRIAPMPDADLLVRLDQIGVRFDSALSAGLLPGGAMKAVFGSHLGRCEILEREPSVDWSAVAGIEDAGAIIDHLVSMRNAELRLKS